MRRKQIKLCVTTVTEQILVSIIILTQMISSSLEIELAMRNQRSDHGFDDDDAPTPEN